ncbi:paraquat-inducible protein A [Pseudoalteromonas tunicata]|jgi:paraquat-inducible protein A|uniref:Paraquat-inducible protein A n=1 Tax=Pseudoalteromonas tunicata D2 TaxID=87626 RepID=A4C4S3_9GAMM|nr:paraquat-inducible protein A [Pseudoalteromonas tunicata]ATC96966.1 paraquat-inducible protein A [Pseudoalteromonas tunicata]AXT33090.1 paraquat-inducible protein A [Pseudoalteromonas tunicata]EAR30555.1 putative protein with paraquat-inducible domain [Pseudoalteromonas tunicata D2]MDP4983969.1 paraquat-inducible protein A [Pseudoalteromonas tunicata]
MPELVACPHCDFLVDLPALAANQRALCPNCGHQLSRGNFHTQATVISMALSALIMLLSSLFYPFISFSNQGMTQTITLLDAAKILFNYQTPILGALLDLCIILLPFLLLVSHILMQLGILSALPQRAARTLLKFTISLTPWVMSEIFLIGVLISMVKIMAMADIAFGLSFWSFCLFVLLYIGCLYRINVANLWQQISDEQITDSQYHTTRAIEHELKACHMCNCLSQDDFCPRCHSPLHLRNPQSTQRVWAFLVTAIILYIPANLYPIMHTVVLSQDEPSTIVGGILILWKMGSYPIALIIFFASVVVPIAKIAVLATLCINVSSTRNFDQQQATQLYKITEFIGKWSMLDVFVVIILVALVQLGNIMSVLPGKGALFFAAMVVTSMLAAHAFDPRLIWDKKPKESNVFTR